MNHYRRFFGLESVSWLALRKQQWWRRRRTCFWELRGVLCCSSTFFVIPSYILKFLELKSKSSFLACFLSLSLSLPLSLSFSLTLSLGALGQQMDSSTTQWGNSMYVCNHIYLSIFCVHFLVDFSWTTRSFSVVFIISLFALGWRQNWKIELDFQPRRKRFCG